MGMNNFLKRCNLLSSITLKSEQKKKDKKTLDDIFFFILVVIASILAWIGCCDFPIRSFFLPFFVYQSGEGDEKKKRSEII